jgi:hypothetical protein
MITTPAWTLSETWSYSLFDGWHRLDCDPMPSTADGSDDLRAAGYAMVFQEHYVWLMEADTETPLTRQYRYVVTFGMAGATHSVYVVDLPSLLELSKSLQLWRIDERVELAGDELVDHARKSFRASHGHSLGGCCPKCDPERYEQIQEARRKRSGGQQG